MLATDPTQRVICLTLTIYGTLVLCKSAPCLQTSPHLRLLEVARQVFFSNAH